MEGTQHFAHGFLLDMQATSGSKGRNGRRHHRLRGENRFSKERVGSRKQCTGTSDKRENGFERRPYTDWWIVLARVGF